MEMNLYIFFTIVAAVISNVSAFPSLENDEKECMRACPATYFPICGSNGNGNYKIFSNDCLMGYENCKAIARHESTYQQTDMVRCRERDFGVNNLFNKNCDSVCADIYEPVCGYDGHSEHRSFPNKCEMEAENCEIIARKGNAFMEVSMEVCEKNINQVPISANTNCPSGCTFDYNPVCGFNGAEYQTFGNKCVFDIQNCESNFVWSLVRTGECPELQKQSIDVKPPCSGACPDNYMPICGTDVDGKSHTYGNQCEFEFYNCNSNYHLRMIKNGEC